MATDDFFRARLDQMIDLRHPLAVLASRMPWSQIEASLAPVFAHRDRKGRLSEGADMFGPALAVAGAGISNAGRPRLPIRLMVALLYLKHAYNESDESLVERWAQDVYFQFFSGQVYFEFLFARVSDGSIELAVATFLRVLAIGLPAVVLFMTVDPTDLADGLAQRVRLPARFVLGSLAGFRLVGLFIDDWRALGLARRARGVADRGRVRRLGGQAFALLVLAIRRGSALATAMEARGFGAEVERVWARESPWGWREWATLTTGLLMGVLAIAAAVVAGTWNFIVG